jgi:N-acetyl sugar amidotransferase
MNSSPAQQCARCVMRVEDDPDLELVEGVCNHCRRYDALLSSRVMPGSAGEEELSRIAQRIKISGRDKAYDCVIGVSGGVDSTYVALLAKRLGLRPLAVHVDNGWNSETAVANIQRTLEELRIDLNTVVLDLREFYDLQRSFLWASTPDGDIPSDHAIQATLWTTAQKHRVKYILSGMNFRTEAMSVKSWSYGHSDWRYIKSVHRAHGAKKLKTYPHFGLMRLFYFTAFRRIRIVSVLNYIDYDKASAERELLEELTWTSYGAKHFESVYTRFYQGYLLPEKFGIDKRRGHMSDLINSGLISRDEALASLLASNEYPDQLRRRDLQLVQKKLHLSDEDLDRVMTAPRRSFADYRNSYDRIQRLRDLVNRLRGKGWYPR